MSRESHQGAAVGSVCGSHEYGQDVVESIAVVLLFVRLCPAADSAADGIGWHRVGQGAMRNYPSEVAEDRRADPGDGAQNLDFACGRLSSCRVVCACARRPGDGLRDLAVARLIATRSTARS